MPTLINPFMFIIPGTFDWLSVVEADHSGTNQSFTSVSFGAAVTSRLLVFAVHWIAVGANPFTLNSATIGGAAATIHVQDGHSGGTTGLGAAIISAALAAGASGTVTLTFSGSVEHATISGFRGTGLVSNTPHDTLEVQGFNDTDISGTINVPENGALIIAGTGSTNTTGSGVAITGATEVYDGDFSSGSGTRAAALSTGLSVETGRTCRYNMGSISNSGTEMMACSWQLQ